MASFGKNVLLFGTFDVANYGDLLFPLLAQRRLGTTGVTVVPVSPTSGDAGYSDAARPISCVDVADQNGVPVDGILIGGGNIIHARKSGLYEEFGVAPTAYSSLWLGATMFACANKIPVAWNAPGVPHKIPASMRLLARACFDAADYISVRDEKSQLNLRAKSHLEVAVVPDTALEISRLWPLRELAAARPEALRSLERYIAVHVKRRSAEDFAQLAKGLDELSVATERPIVLLALGRCHGDDVAAQELGALMQRPNVVLDNLASLQETTAAIALADIYVSTSLHGYISSYSYGRPGILVTRPELPKFDAFATHVGRTEDLVRDWPMALDLAHKRLQRMPERQGTIPQALMGRLDEHWAAIERALQERNAMPRQGDFLRTAIKVGMRQGWHTMLQSLRVNATRSTTDPDGR